MPGNRGRPLLPLERQTLEALSEHRATHREHGAKLERRIEDAVLRYSEKGVSVREIARALDVSPTTVQTFIERARVRWDSRRRDTLGVIAPIAFVLLDYLARHYVGFPCYVRIGGTHFCVSSFAIALSASALLAILARTVAVRFRETLEQNA